MSCGEVLQVMSPFYYRMQWTAEGSISGAVSLMVFVYEISRELLNGFAPNSHRRRVWSLARTSLKVKVIGQGHQGQRRCVSALSAACVRFVFSKTSLATSCCCFRWLQWTRVYDICVFMQNADTCISRRNMISLLMTLRLCINVMFIYFFVWNKQGQGHKNANQITWRQ